MYLNYRGFRHLLRLFLTAALVSAFFSCAGPGKNDAQPGKEAGGQGAARPAGSSDLAALLPGTEVPGWRLSGEVRVFHPDNLWEYIDGGAEGYLVYNFQAVATADYENEGAGLQAVVDIYQMADDLCGFGIYASERSYSARYLDIGAQGYLTENSLHLYQGPYYLKLTAFQEGEQVGGQLEALAVEILERIGGKAEVPEELSIFPGDNLVANSERYLARDVLGQSDLKNGFTAEYQMGENEFKLFFILHDDLSSAARSFESYRAFMEKYGKNLQGHEDEDIRWFTADDSYYGRVVTEHTGKVVLGILGAPDVEVVNEYLRQMRQKLISMGKV